VYVFSVTDGDEKPVKYPRLFKEIELVVVNKIDLLPFTDFSLSHFEKRLRQVNPLVPLIKLSCRSGVGLDHWRKWVLELYGQDIVEESGNLPRLNNYPGISCF
ncbi:MAG: hydrogenase nickel incorporation protein HypB, partial [Firmicutes bacterium]|nr:hydrogenase nickel incorporation protein HypB [Bacillota bacterium]